MSMGHLGCVLRKNSHLSQYIFILWLIDFLRGKNSTKITEKFNFFLGLQKYDLEGQIEVFGQHWSEID